MRLGDFPKPELQYIEIKRQEKVESNTATERYENVNKAPPKGRAVRTPI